MIFINRTETDPLFNIAAEEYVLKHFTDDVLMLWQSRPSVVIGKHQNLVAEVNLNYTRQNNIPVLRRISGGGTVYHDLGNLNYTFIRSEENRERLIDFKAFSKPVIEFLKTLGIKAEVEGKSNLVVDGKKFSGNAAHVFKNRVIHHGTLLYNSNLDELEKVIRPANAQINDKSIKSVRATVTNLADKVKNPLTIKEFSEQLARFLITFYNIDKSYSFTQQDKEAVRMLMNEKYGTVDWNYGYSPAYEFENRIGNASLRIKVKKGRVEHADLKGFEPINQTHFTGVMHRYENIKDVIDKHPLSDVQQQTLLHLFGF